MKRNKFYAILSAVLLVALLAGGAVAQSPVSQFDTILADRLIATDSVDAADMTVSGTLDAGTLNATGTSALGAADFAGNVTMQAQLSVDGPLVAATQLNLVPGSPISVTAGAIITPTAAFQLLEAAGSLSSGEISNSCSSGQLVTLMNTANVTITIPDSGENILSAAAALGQWDTLTVICYAGTKWFEVARSNN